MKRAIVTGASGFVGANLARRLLRDGHEVHLLVRRTHVPWRIEGIESEVSLHQVDLGDLSELITVVGAIRPDWVFHLAAYGAYPFQNDVYRMVQTNVVGTINLIEACAQSGFESLVNTGSSSEYGFQEHPPAETERLEPNSHYAVTKAAATQYCRLTARNKQVCLPTLRLYSVYGPYEEPTRLIPTLIVRGLRGELPPLVEPTIARDYISVDDVCEAYLVAAAQPNQEPGAVYNVGTGIQTSLSELLEVTRQILPIGVEPKWGTMPNRRWDTNIWVADNRKIQSELGWRPRYSVELGIRKMVQWFQDNPKLLALYQRCQYGDSHQHP